MGDRASVDPAAGAGRRSTRAADVGHGVPRSRTGTRRRLSSSACEHSSVFDWIVDFDEAVRDPQRPVRLRAEFDPGDHIHPNDAGNRAMAAAFNLKTFLK